MRKMFPFDDVIMDTEIVFMSLSIVFWAIVILLIKGQFQNIKPREKITSVRHDI